MNWKDSTQTAASIRSRFDKSERARIGDLFAASEFLDGSLPTAEFGLDPGWETGVVLSDYGKQAIGRLDKAGANPVELAMAALIVFFHRDFLIDIGKSDPQLILKSLDGDMRKGRLRLPYRFGRTLYDRFNDMPGNSRVSHLEAKDVDVLLEGTEQGVYQIGRYVAGPLGLLESRDQRYVPPSLSLPLWHCSDPGCQQLHFVSLTRHQIGAFSLVRELRDSLMKIEGRQSEWQAYIRRIHRDPTKRGKDYYDICALVADAMPAVESKTLLAEALASSVGSALRDALKSAVNGKKLSQGSASVVAGGLTEGQCQQLLMVLSDKELVALIDAAIRAEKIKVPSTEIRKSYSHPPTLSNYDRSTALSALGTRCDQSEPVLFLTSTIRDEYERIDQLSELEWRCGKGANDGQSTQPIDYFRSHTARDAIRNLVLSSGRITLAVANKLQMQLDPAETEEDTINRFLWKFGFNPARYDLKYQRLRMQLQRFQEELLKARPVLTEDDRDSIRSRGVNVFVAIENLLEELISYNVWLLASDHFSHTKFRYKFEDAVSKVGDTLGDVHEINGHAVTWNRKGGNTLGVLLVYARLSADWFTKLPSTEKGPLRKAAADLPHYVDHPAYGFPFNHCALWADASERELIEYGAQYNKVVESFERSRLAEVRNGLDHYRDAQAFPSVDLLIACEARISAALNAADVNRFIPKAFWLVEAKRDEFGLIEQVLKDYQERKLVIRGPRTQSGLRDASFSRPLIVPFGNLLGHPNAELVFQIVEDSPYSVRWSNYPRRRKSEGNDQQKHDESLTDSPHF